MDLTKVEKKLIVDILNTHLADVRKVEKFSGQSGAMFGAELNYEAFLKKIIRKIN